MHTRTSASALFLCVALGFSSSTASAQTVGQQCRDCLNNELSGLGQNAAATAALGAIGGLAAGSAPGAVCGAVIGAAGVGITFLINVANKCVPVCKSGREPASVAKCDELLTKSKG